MRVITPNRTVDSPAIGSGLLTCGFQIFMASKQKKLQNSTRKTVAPVDSHKCTGNPYAFSYICDEYKGKRNRQTITDKIKQLYLDCFGFDIAHQTKNWVLHIVRAAYYTYFYTYFFTHFFLLWAWVIIDLENSPVPNFIAV